MLAKGRPCPRQLNRATEVPDDVRHELIDAIERGKRLIRGVVLAGGLEYAKRHLGIEHPTAASLWEYVLDRRRSGYPLRYVRLDDHPDRFDYAMRKADGVGLYTKLMFDDETNTVLMSFHG